MASVWGMVNDTKLICELREIKSVLHLSEKIIFLWEMMKFKQAICFQVLIAVKGHVSAWFKYNVDTKVNILQQGEQKTKI